jgi:hypothetical protein
MRSWFLQEYSQYKFMYFLLVCNLISVLSFVEACLFSLKMPRHLCWLKFIFLCRCSILCSIVFYQIGLSVTKSKHVARGNVTSCLVIKKFCLTVWVLLFNIYSTTGCHTPKFNLFECFFVQVVCYINKEGYHNLNEGGYTSLFNVNTQEPRSNLKTHIARVLIS